MNKIDSKRSFTCWSITIFVLVVLVAGALFASQFSFVSLHRGKILRSTSNCRWKSAQKVPPIYWINLERSRDRKYSFEESMTRSGLRHHRVTALLPSQIEVDITIKSAVRNNSALEFATISSHILAMQAALKNAYGDPYALIFEDDVEFPFEIDFHKLLKKLPRNFGIVQLVTSHTMSLPVLFDRYVADSNDLFSSRNNKFWSAQGYLINTRVIKNYITRALEFDSRKQKYVLHFAPYGEFLGLCEEAKLATKQNRLNELLYSKQVKEATQPLPSKNNFFDVAHAVKSNTLTKEKTSEEIKGQQKENENQMLLRAMIRPYNESNICSIPFTLLVETFLFCGGPAYLSHIPLLKSAAVGLNSTVHQEHVAEFHAAAFKQIDYILDKLTTNVVALPPFLSRLPC